MPTDDRLRAEFAAAEEEIDLAPLQRVEVYQATGMVMDQLDVSAAEALAHLRARAFSRTMTVGELAWEIIRRQYRFDPDGGHESGDGQ